jgi:hypothetical protein
MSQHDFNIANQGFPATRTDLNNALAALATNSSGASAPSTTYAYQWWYDSTTNVLKMRNADNDAWINFAYFNQVNDTWLIQQDSNGNVGIGAAAAASAILDLTSTTKGFRAPSMTTTQRNAISSPATGLLIYNTTTAAYEFYNGSAWQQTGGAGGMTLLGTLTTTSGSVQTLSGLNLTDYKEIVAEINSISHNSGSAQAFSFGPSTYSATNNFSTGAGASDIVAGMIFVSLNSGVGTAITCQGSALPLVINAGRSYVFATGLTTASTSISVTVGGGSFDAGSIRVYGVK